VTADILSQPRSADSISKNGGASGVAGFLRYLGKKLVGAVISFIMLMVVGYVLFNLIPSNPLEAVIRTHPHMSVAQLAFYKQEYGLDESPLQRFWSFLTNTLRGNLGYSWQFQQPVSSLILQRLWPTLLLTGVAMIVSVTIGLWLGSRAGWRPGSLLDRTSSGVSLAFWSVPTFWLGLILLLIFTVMVAPGALPSGGLVDPGTPGGLPYVLSVLRHLVLPCVTQVLVIIAQYVTIMRSSMIDELGSPYLLTARAKGLRDVEIRDRHAVPNALLPSVTVIFVQLGLLVTGVVTVETVFTWPGLGYLTYQALQIPDLPLLEGTFVVFGASVIVMNLIADMLYRYIDPRVRRQ
jgi:peptide/nickel transport system permease protein